MKNEKKLRGFSFLYIKYGKFWSISLGHFIKHKPLIPGDFISILMLARSFEKSRDQTFELMKIASRALTSLGGLSCTVKIIILSQKMMFFLCSRQTTNSFVFVTRKITSITRYCFSKSPIMDQKVLKFPQKKRHDTTGNHPAGSKQIRNRLVFWQLLFVYIRMIGQSALVYIHARMHSRRRRMSFRPANITKWRRRKK